VSALDNVRKMKAEIQLLRNALHRISLASQNSMSNMAECGRIAREALAHPQQLLPDGEVTLRVRCEDCGHEQDVRGVRAGGSTYFGSGYDFCDVCDGKPYPLSKD
jgi:ribosomal protein L44E